MIILTKKSMNGDNLLDFDCSGFKSNTTGSLLSEIK